MQAKVKGRGAELALDFWRRTLIYCPVPDSLGAALIAGDDGRLKGGERTINWRRR